jgi:hypothetical protein
MMTVLLSKRASILWKSNILVLYNRGCTKNGVLTVHHGVEEITVSKRQKNDKKILLDLLADLAVFEIYV